MLIGFFFKGYVSHRDLHLLTHSCPTRRSSVLVDRVAGIVQRRTKLLRQIGVVLDHQHAHVPPAGAYPPPSLMSSTRPESASTPRIWTRPSRPRDRKSTRLNSSH